MGLPLCRLYTKYLGGSLQLMSVPGAGGDGRGSSTAVDGGDGGVDGQYEFVVENTVSEMYFVSVLCVCESNLHIHENTETFYYLLLFRFCPST